MSYRANLMSAFIHTPSEYTLVGVQKNTAGTCACGKNINNLFTVAHPEGHTVVLGSECINNYEELGHINQALLMQHEVEKSQRKVARELAKAKAEAEAEIEKKRLKEVVRALVSQYRSDLSRHEYYAATYYKLSGKNVNRVKQMNAILSRLQKAISELNQKAS